MNARRQIDWDDSDFALADEVADITAYYRSNRPGDPRVPPAVDQRVRRLYRQRRRADPVLDWLLGQVPTLALAVLLLFAVGAWVLWLEQRAPVPFGGQVYVVTARDAFSDFRGDRALVMYETDQAGHAEKLQILRRCREINNTCEGSLSPDFDRRVRDIVLTQRYHPQSRLVAVVLLEPPR